MLKSQSYNPPISFRSSNSPPFPLQSFQMQNHYQLQHHLQQQQQHYLTSSSVFQGPSVSFNQIPNNTSNSITANPVSSTQQQTIPTGPIGSTFGQNLASISIATSPPNHQNKNLQISSLNAAAISLPPSSSSPSSSASSSSSLSSSTSSSASSSSSSPPSNSTITPDNSISQGGSQSTITTANTSTASHPSSASNPASTMSSSSSFFPSASGFQPFIPAQYTQAVIHNNQSSSSSASYVPSNIKTSPTSLHMSVSQQPSYYSMMSEQHTQQQQQQQQAQQDLGLAYPCLRVLNLPRDIQEREFEIMFTFADSFIGSELKKTSTIADDGLPASVIGFAYFKTLSAASKALAILSRNLHLFTPKEVLMRPNSLPSSHFALKIDLLHNNRITESSLTGMNAFVQQQQQPLSQQDNPMISNQYKPVSRFVFAGNQQQQQQQQHAPLSASLDIPPSYNDMYDAAVNPANTFLPPPPASPRGMFPLQAEDYNNIPRMSGKSLLLESQGREDEEYNDIVKDVGWFSQGSLGNQVSSSSSPNVYKQQLSTSSSSSSPPQQTAIVPKQTTQVPSTSGQPQQPSQKVASSSSSTTSSPPPSTSTVIKPSQTASSPTKGKSQISGKISNTTVANGSSSSSTSINSSNNNSINSNTVSSSSTNNKHGNSRVFNGNGSNAWNGDSTASGTNGTTTGKKGRNNSSNIRTSFQSLSLNSGGTGNVPSGPSATNSSNGNNSNGKGNGSGSPLAEGPKVVVVPFAPGTPGGANAIHIMQTGSRVLPAANPADQNPPCNTLYVGNLPPDTNEEELKSLFSTRRGYKRLCFRTKANGPMCFVEFDDVSLATRALEELYGHILSNSVKGGIRLSFSKNPLGVRSPPSNGSGNVAVGSGSNGSQGGSSGVAGSSTGSSSSSSNSVGGGNNGAATGAGASVSGNGVSGVYSNKGSQQQVQSRPR